MHKISIHLLLALLLFSGAHAAQKGFSAATMGSQYLLMPPASDSVVAPQFLRPIAAVFSITSLTLTNNATLATLALAGDPPLDSYGVPLSENRFQYASGTQPETYFALVTSGKRTGTIFLVASNTATTVTVDAGGLPLAAADIKAIEIHPCWTLRSLFPPAQTDISFVSSPDGDPDVSAIANVSPTLVSIPDFAGSGTSRPVSASYFFNDKIGDWATTDAPAVAAGDTFITPGEYVIVTNEGSSSFPLHEYIAGAAFYKDFTFFLATLANAAQDTYLAIPRASDYKITEIGFSDANFVQSTSKSNGGRNDLLIVSDATGAAAATYYRYKNQWYDTSNDAFSTNPAIPAGTALTVQKVLSDGADKILLNKANITPMK